MNHQSKKKNDHSADPGSHRLEAHIETLELRCKRLRKSLRETQQKVRFLHSLVQEPVIGFEPDGTIFFWNQKDEAVLGLIEDDVVGRNFFDLIVAADDRERIRGILNKVGDLSEPLFQAEIAEFSALTKEHQTVQLQMAFNLHMGKDCRFIYGIFGSPKNTDSDNLMLLGVSQQIRSPMSAILGMVQLALNTQLTKEQREYLEILKSSADSLLALFNDVLVFSKIESGLLDLDEIEFDLYSAVDKAVEAVTTRAHDGGITLTFDRPNNAAQQMVVGDPGRFRQILLNVLDSHIKHRNTRHLSIRMEVRVSDKDLLESQITINNPDYRLPEESLSGIFKPQFSTAISGEISSLSLPICKQLVEMMKGRIWIDNLGERGVEFHVLLPFKTIADRKKHVVKEDWHECGSIRVLHVDNSLTERMVLEEFTTSRNAEYTGCQHGQQALELLKQATLEGKPFQVLFSDTQLADIDGFSLVDKIRGIPEIAGTQVVFISSVGQRGDAVRCRDRGISAYLMKPVSQIEFSETLKKLCQMISSDRKTEEPALITRHSIREDLQKRNLIVVLIDDNPLDRELSKEILSKVCNTVLVPDSIAAVRSADPFKSCDLAFIDLHLQENSVDEIVEVLRSRKGSRGPIPVIAILDPDQSGDMKKCAQLNIDHYVTKPLKTGEVNQAIQDITDQVSDNRALVKKPKPEIVKTKPKYQFTRILKSFYGDLDLLRHAFKLFLEHHAAQVEALHKSIEIADPAQLEKAARDFKKSASNFGDNELIKTAAKLEAAGKNKKLDTADQLLMELETELAEFINYIRVEIKRNH